MKNNYRKLKFSILLETVLITALTVLVGGFLLNYVVDGIYNDSFAKGFVKFMEAFHMEEQTAIHLYWRLIGNNKIFFLIMGFLLLFALFFYIALTQMTRYLDQVGDGIENILSESSEPIHLITELKPIEIRLNEIKATLKRQELEAVESEKRKNDMVLFLAHDLKTPLTSVVAYLTMLDSHPDMSAEERAKYTHISLEKAIRLGDLINEFFDITKFSLQEFELEPVDLNLSMMLEQIADELYGVLQEKHLTCEVEAEDDLEIEGDPDKLARVFDNILRNAVAYCYENTTIRIDAHMKRGDVEIVFQNEGKKIPGAKLQTIFEKFYRLDDSRSTETGGAGVGLAIAREIVELHGGRIIAKSDDNKTQFVVTLPSKNKQEEGDSDEVHTHSGRASRGKSGRRKKVQRKRKNEIWDSFRKVIEVCRREETDLLLIAGDLFHRQPLLRELKEVDAMFGSIPHTQVVLVAGNHDYIKKQSYYRNYTWNQNVHMILSDEVSCIQLPTMNLAVYGCSYYEKENRESLYEQIELKDICRYHILLAHGGDTSHLPFRKTVVDEIGFDYVALGHIHKPEILIPNRMAYAGALEPIDRNDTGVHGFVRGILGSEGCRISFAEHAEREYVHMDVPVEEHMTGYDLHTRIDELIGQRGVQNMYCLSLEGRRDPDVAFDLSQMDTFGNVLEIMDHTRPAYDYEKLLGRNRENLLGRYIASFEGAEADSTEYAALCEGVQALLDTRREQG